MRSFIEKLILLSLLLAVASFARAAIESYDFQDEAQRARYQQLTEELRCPKCQNQNLADSDSQIAADLRRELHAQLIAGKSDEAILDFMRERYGDFVLYKPRVERKTWLLWFGPVVLLVLVVGLVLLRRPAGAAEGKPVHASASTAAAPVAVGLSPGLRRLVAVLAVLLVTGGSLWLYRQLGALQALNITEEAHVLFSGTVPAEVLPARQTALLAELDEWLLQHPEQEQFQYLRARLLAETGDFEKAGQDYRDLIARFPDQDNLLAEYAQLLFLQQGRILNEDAIAFLQQALSVNPDNVTALGLLGMQAFEKADYRQAVEYWQRLLDGLPPGSPQADTILGGIERARELGHLPAESETAKAAADVRVSVQVTLDATAAARPDETVFVLLRAAGGRGMPLAATRTTVSALAQPLLLDTANSPMRAQAGPPPAGPLEVVARLSRSGQPMAAAGDWEGVVRIEDRAALSEAAPLSVQIAHPVQP